MSATELAERLEKWQMICRDDMADWQAAIAELRRIPELERRALDDEEIAIMCLIHDHLPSATADLAPLVARLRPPKPLLMWSDHGNGVWTAQHDGATYLLTDQDKYVAVSRRPNISTGVTICETIDAAKATAEKWAGGR